MFYFEIFWKKLTQHLLIQSIRGAGNYIRGRATIVNLNTTACTQIYYATVLQQTVPLLLHDVSSHLVTLLICLSEQSIGNNAYFPKKEFI